MAKLEGVLKGTNKPGIIYWIKPPGMELFGREEWPISKGRLALLIIKGVGNCWEIS